MFESGDLVQLKEDPGRWGMVLYLKPHPEHKGDHLVVVCLEGGYQEETDFEADQLVEVSLLDRLTLVPPDLKCDYTRSAKLRCPKCWSWLSRKGRRVPWCNRCDPAQPAIAPKRR